MAPRAIGLDVTGRQAPCAESRSSARQAGRPKSETPDDSLNLSACPAQGSRQLIERGIQLCCVSLGAEGAYFDNGSASGYVPAFDVKVLDTTGSGDAFVAGLAYGLSDLSVPVQELERAELRQMVAFANACGALAATRVGAMSALPTLAAVEGLLGTGT